MGHRTIRPPGACSRHFITVNVDNKFIAQKSILKSKTIDMKILSKLMAEWDPTNPDDLEWRMNDHELSIDRLWVLTSAAMIFLMQAGFSLVESGSVRPKSNSNILIKNLFDA